MTTKFKRGDIINVTLDPSQGREQKGILRPCLILSNIEYNSISGTIYVAPITSGGNSASKNGFAVELDTYGTITAGRVLSNQIRTIDPTARCAVFVEHAPQGLVDEVLARFYAICSEGLD